MMTNEQLELGFNQNQNQATAPCGRGRKRESRVARGQWWFARMREVVARTVDWQEAGSPRPEQILIPGAIRQIKI